MEFIKKNCFRATNLLLIAFVFCVLQGIAQTSGNSISSQASLVTEFDVNGLKVLVKRRPNSQTVAAGLFIRGGSRNLTTQTAGIEDLTLSVATEASKNFPREAMRRELASTGSSISSGANYDFSVLALASTRQSFDRSWEIFADVALNPAFTQNDFELTREKTLTALKNTEDDADSYLDALVNKTIYANTPYQSDPNGTIETISKFKADDLRAYHKKIMQTSRLLLVIVGDLDPAKLQQKISTSFGKLPRGVYKDAPLPAIDFSKPTLNVTSRDLPTNYIKGIFAAPAINNPDYCAMQVATTLLRERIFEEVRNKRNLSYAPNADMGLLAINTGNIYVTAVDANQSVSVMLDEIRKMKDSQVDAREISGVAGQFLTTYFVDKETNAAQARDLALNELIGNGWRKGFEFLDRVKAVTPLDVQRVSQKYMKNIRFVVLGKPEYVNRGIFLTQK